MAAQIGRSGSIQQGTVALIGIRSISIDFENTAIDTSDADSSGFKEYLSTPGEKSATMSLDGIWKDPTLRALAATGDITLDDCTVNFANGATLVGNLVMTAYNETMPYKEGVTFTCTLTTNGSYTYTP